MEVRSLSLPRTPGRAAARLQGTEGRGRRTDICSCVGCLLGAALGAPPSVSPEKAYQRTVRG
eukprot:scaffold42878_cov71-Phaeocystis_antarctica.AAC.3